MLCDLATVIVSDPGPQARAMRVGMRTPLMTKHDLELFLFKEFPQMFNASSGLTIDETWHGGCRIRQAYREHFIRPGGTISGPTMMALADTAMYVAILAAIGPVALAVTTSLNINFLRKPDQKDLIAECRLLKLGKRLAVGDVTMRSEGHEELVAHATSTYSIPPRHS